MSVASFCIRVYVTAAAAAAAMTKIGVEINGVFAYDSFVVVQQCFVGETERRARQTPLLYPTAPSLASTVGSPGKGDICTSHTDGVNRTEWKTLLSGRVRVHEIRPKRSIYFCRAHYRTCWIARGRPSVLAARRTKRSVPNVGRVGVDPKTPVLRPQRKTLVNGRRAIEFGVK